MDTTDTTVVTTEVITNPVKTGSDKLLISLAGAVVSFAAGKLIEEGYTKFVINRRTVEIIETIVTDK